LAYAIQRRFRKVRYITLVNLLASKDIFVDEPFDFDPDSPDAASVPLPEYLTFSDKSRAMAAHIVRWLNDPAAYRAQQDQLIQLRNEILSPLPTRQEAGDVQDLAEQGGAAGRAAAYILAVISATPRSPNAHQQGQVFHGDAHRPVNSSIMTDES
jgi:lipid A disaccharide synthetase